MKIKVGTIIFVFAALIFSSCKDQDSKKTSTETEKIVEEESVEIESKDDGEDAKLLDRIENYILREYLTERDLRTISKDQRKFQLHKIDLNNDGKEELFINFMTSYFCGTGGCSILLLTDEMKPITEFTVTKTPIYVEETMENGWRILMVESEGKWRKLIYEEGSYPSNPSVIEISSDSPTESADILFGVNNAKLKTYSF